MASTTDKNPIPDTPNSTPDLDLREPEPVSFHPQAPSQLWHPWTLVVPALLVLPMLSLAFAWQISPSDDADLRRPIRHYPRGDEIWEPEPTPQATKAPSLTAKAPPTNQLPRFTMFVPAGDGKLHARTTLATGVNGAADFVQFGTAALKNLFPIAPDYFPAGTQLQSLALDESSLPVARVSLNEKFWNSDYWTGETRTDLALQAIAHTLQAA